MMDGKILTTLRTGAVGGVGIRHTTPDTVKTVGLIGAGAQGFYQLLFACKARKMEKITIYDPYVKDLSSFVDKITKELPNIEVNIANTVEELLENSEVIIAATTSNEPVLPDNSELLKGKHFVGIGSYKPNMREFPDSIFSLLDKVYIDTEFAKEETGDLAKPLSNKVISEENVETFGSYLINEKNKDEIVSGTTFFKSVGMALFDITVAQLIYNKAKENNVGQKIKL
jgi:ornithine cyclodeaminase